MAIGLAKMFGIDFKENFNFPYTARSVTEFWRRWHISLSTWFRDYLYIPLGGNRRGPLRTYLNLMLVFLLCGFWHGASWTFAAWGLFHGAFLVLERSRMGRLVESLWAPARHALHPAGRRGRLGLVPGRILADALAFLQAMAGMGRGTGLAYHTGLYLDSQLVLALLAGVIGSAPMLPLLARVRGASSDCVRWPCRIDSPPRSCVRGSGHPLAAPARPRPCFSPRGLTIPSSTSGSENLRRRTGNEVSNGAGTRIVSLGNAMGVREDRES